MATLQVPVMSWPFRMGGVNASEIAYIEQDSGQEIAQCVGMVFSVRRGDLVDEPQLGISDPSFVAGGLTEAALVAAAQEWEPRAAINFSRDEIKGIAQTMGIEVSDAV
jgi:hypothetical protein